CPTSRTGPSRRSATTGPTRASAPAASSGTASPLCARACARPSRRRGRGPPADRGALERAGAGGAAVLFNLLALPRLAPSIFREGERGAPWRSGIVIYPIAVLLLVILFHR